MGSLLMTAAVRNLRLSKKGSVRSKYVCCHEPTGLPDGLFSNQKFQFWYNLECLRVENIVIHHEHFKAIWNNLWPFGIVCGHLVYFPHFGMFGPRKIWQPWPCFKKSELKMHDVTARQEST
jgi:hypothetical protein